MLKKTRVEAIVILNTPKRRFPKINGTPTQEFQIFPKRKYTQKTAILGKKNLLYDQHRPFCATKIMSSTQFNNQINNQINDQTRKYNYFNNQINNHYQFNNHKQQPLSFLKTFPKITNNFLFIFSFILQRTHKLFRYRLQIYVMIKRT